jgi:CRISPR-associated endonuclease/helicase Cas3
VHVGVPSLHVLRPAAALVSRIVSIKGFLEPEPFRLAVKRQLAGLELQNAPEVDVGLRRVLRIKDKVIVGFVVQLRGLTEPDSLVVQGQGLGGRRHFGCGLFVPFADDLGADRGDRR